MIANSKSIVKFERTNPQPMNTTTPTKWPHACKKNYLYNKLYQINTREVREEVYRIIMNNRGVTEETAKRVSVLRKNEVKDVLIAFGELD